MSWQLGSTTIFVQKMVGQAGQIIPRIQTLSAGTTLQFFGYENVITKITCKVVGETDRDAILTMRTDAALHTLTGPGGFSESYYIKNVEWSREDTIYQTIRQDLACDAIVFTMEIEFYE